MTYNSAGQPLTVTNAKNETTTYTYETGTDNLLTVTGPVTGATTTYTYDAYGRVESVEDARRLRRGHRLRPPQSRHAADLSRRHDRDQHVQPA